MSAPAAPDAAMMAGPEALAHFIETGASSSLDGVFADGDVAILENFAPHLFAGAGAVEAWTRGMRQHVEILSDMRCAFGAAQDFGLTGELAYFCLPTDWRGASRGRPFREQGGWAFVLVRQGAAWRIRNYAWAVTGIEAG